MKNLFVILGILGAIFIVILSLLIWQLKDINFNEITAWFNPAVTNEASLNLNATEDINDIENYDETEDFSDEEYEDVGDLDFYTRVIGRADFDIQSKRTYTFYVPVGIDFELQGVDASSGVFLFKKAGQEIFKMTSFDYARSEDDIDEFWPTADDYSLVGGHTNILELIDDDYEDEMYIFADTLKIDDEAAL